MPSRHSLAISPPASSSSPRTHDFFILAFAIAGGIVAFCAFVLLLFILYRRWRCQQLASHHLGSVTLHKFTYRELKAATGSFSADHKLGQGGFGAVYKGILRNGQEIAVKKLDTASLQGEREFQNEVSVIGQVNSPHIVGLLGFCIDGKRRLLVYEYMHNRSLQEALFDDDRPVNLDWDRRFRIILDTAHALAFLHTKCDPPIIHGDIKPSNILLDCKLSARIADFGLARLKTEIVGPEFRSEDVEAQHEREKTKVQSRCVEKEKKRKKKESTESAKKQQAYTENTAHVGTISAAVSQNAPFKYSPSDLSTSPNSEDPCGSFSVDLQSSDFHEQERLVHEGRDEAPLSENASAGGSPFRPNVKGDEGLSVTKSPEAEFLTHDSCLDQESEKISVITYEERSTDMPKEELEVEEKTSQSEGCFEKLSIDSGKELRFAGPKFKEGKRGSFGRDWWWRQEYSGEFSVKEYVMDWMGQDSKAEKPRNKDLSWREHHSGGEIIPQERPKPAEGWKGRRRDRSRSSEWWANIFNEEETQSTKDKLKGKSKRVEWWKEEYYAELSNKSKEAKKKSGEDRQCSRSASLEWWRDDASQEGSAKSKKSNKEKRQKDKSCKDEEVGISKENKGGKKKREKSLSRDWYSGEIMSRGVSSTPSMRGTICYVAPEYGGGGILSEKSDVYSFGVLLLVIVSGRRPLQVMDSPLTEFQRANLISWARHLAQSGNVLELVDSALHGEYCRDQATLCITAALMCLQRLPAVRPCMNEVVKILSGEVEAPSLPFEFSPSPPCGVPFKSRRCSLSSERVAID